MTAPVIDPSTLTEEQKNRIKDAFFIASKTNVPNKDYAYGTTDILKWLFGEEFFNTKQE